MPNDLFLFHTIRAPQSRCESESGVVRLYRADDRSGFLRDLQRTRQADRLLASINAFVNDPRFVHHDSRLPIDISGLTEALFGACERTSLDRGNMTIEQILLLPATLAVQTPEYREARTRIADS